jgi:hypothetical protein
MRLIRRVDALERIAERARLRRWEALANERGITLDVLVEHYAEAQAESARLRAEGVSDDEIFALKAGRLGIPVEELCRRADELVRRLS